MAGLFHFYVYSWHIDEHEKDVTCIRAYGINEKNENVCVRIDDFTPYVYVELPTNISWNNERAQLVVNSLERLLGQKQKPLKKSLVFMKRLYFAHLDANNNRKEFPYLFLSFSNKDDIRSMSFKTKKGVTVPGLGIVINFRIHEEDASPILQLTCTQDIPSCGWITFMGRPIVDEENRATLCTHEYSVKFKHLVSSTEKHILNTIISPLIMSYDLEVYSSDPNKMPTASNPKDVIFQISCIFARNGDGDEKFENFLLTLGEPDKFIVGANVTVREFKFEHELITGFVDLIHEKEPNIITGYNIFKFDIPYMIERSKLHRVYDELQLQGFHKYNRALEKIIKWSSAAFKNQEFNYLDAEGRLFVDLMVIVKRDYKMDSYALKMVSTHFLKETKDPLSPKGIFKCYEAGMRKGQYGSKAMGVVGKYCVQDSVLVLRLFRQLHIWFGLAEMAAVTNIPVFATYTQGQQIKVYSQVYKKCMKENFVVEKNGYTIKSGEEHYQGALVFEPDPGVYDMVISHDFSSLYPSIMIAYNLDYSTLLPDDSTIPDSDCNIIAFSEHQGCCHDKTVRKQKAKWILCGDKQYKFLKTHKGILPSLVEDLLAARKKTKREITDLKNLISDPSTPIDEKKNMENFLIVLDKRQLSYKVSANSSYGSTGVQRGYLPCMPIAASITAYGRSSILKVFDVITTKYKAKIILSDTDSVYSVFEHLGTDTKALWEYAELISTEISLLFPKPMKLEFEGFIYWRLLTLTKKRYVSLKCNKEGVVSKELEKKGVLLARRDNSKYIRDVYQDTVMKIFNRVDNHEILYGIIEHVNMLSSNLIPAKDFVITRAVGDGGHGIESLEEIPGNPFKVKLGGYTVPLLAKEEGKKRTAQLALKNAQTDEEFYAHSLPAQVQLAQRIRDRGGIVDIGTRLEYVILDIGNPKAKLYAKFESYEYYKEFTSVLKIDKMYYMKQLINCLDQMIGCTLKEKAGTKFKLNAQKFMTMQFKYRTQKMNMIAELKKLLTPTLVFIE